ncbi:MAG: DUF2178 domain-containing protein [Candidatus Falkowbacteria bacterium]
MTLKNYQKIKLVFVFFLALIFSQTIYYKNYLIPIALMIVSSLILMWLRRRVKGVVADERDYATGGKSALLTIQVYAWIASISMFILYALRDANPSYEPIAMTLAFSTCILMLLYAVIFRYFDNFKFSDKKTIYSFLIFILFLVLAVFSIRLFSGEDNWVCRNGAWQKHGQPSFPAPSTECK